MVNLIVVKNPFKPEQREQIYMPYRKGKKIKFYFREGGNWAYSINGEIKKNTDVVKDNDYIVVMPIIEGKVFGAILSIGLSVFTGGIASGAIFGITSVLWRTAAAMAIGMLGNSLLSKLTAPKIDNSNTEQSQTYGWNGAKTVTGQGYPLAVTYGTMKSGGVLLSRHVISDGEKQYLNMLYCAGEGELSSINDIQINGNPIGNYQDVQVDIRLGTNDQAVISNFNDNFADQQLNYELTENWSTQQVQGDACNAIELTVGFPNGLYYSNDSGDMDKTWVTLEAEIRKVGETTWHSLPLANQPGMEAYVVKNKLLWEFQKRNGIAIANNVSSNEYAGKINQATNTAFYRVFRFDDLDKAKYEVRMRCSNKDGKSLRHVNKVYWSQLTQILYDDFIHPGKALIGIKALATSQLSGSDPEVTWIQSRNTVYVFNPYINAYEAKTANNPAWACYDLLHIARKISNEYVVFGQEHARIDYDAFKAWADKCTEKGFEFNYVYDSANRLWDALKYPETVGRGKVVPQGTRFTCVCDYLGTPVQLFTVANIKGNSFSEIFQSTESRANAVEISFMNKEKDYERDVIPVYSEDYDEQDTLTSPTQIELMGCTSLQEAFKHGKYYLRCNKYEVRTVTIEAYADAIACTMGDIILIQHDVPEWGEGGRIVDVNGQVITLDKQIDSTSGKNYQLLVRDNTTDSVHTLTVTSVNGANVTVQEAIYATADCMYAFGEVNKAAKPFRVLSIVKGNTDLTRKIEALEYYPEIYVSDDGQVPTINYASTIASEIVSVALTSSLYSKDGAMLSKIGVTWQLPRSGYIHDVIISYKLKNSDTWIYYG